MSYIYLLCIFLLKCYFCLQLAAGWDYLNLQCRDNDNEPVDWWYIYKPPSNLGPHLETGVNFSYITPDTVRRWTPSRTHIFGDSMLRHTTAPMFDEKYAAYIAVADYDGKEPMGDFMGSASRGMMMANSFGGIWLGHTVPGFPDFTKGAPMFPPEELKNGHLFMCLSLDLPTLNVFATAIKQTEPYIKRIFIPQKIDLLTEWKTLLSPLPKISRTSVRKTKILHFVTRYKSLSGIMFARSPGDSRCLYKSFAKSKKIVMDVYGHREHQNIYCGKQYSVRNINSISLKYLDFVYYIKNASDSMGFAVSTAAFWQRNGLSKNKYWTCTGNMEYQLRNSMGGMIACVTNLHVWLSFDNLKVREPECNTIEDI